MRLVSGYYAAIVAVSFLLYAGQVSPAFAQQGAPAAAEPPGGASGDNVFARPAFAAEQQRLTLPVVGLFRDRRYAAAEKMLRDLVGKYPTWAIHHYNLAAALARQDKKAEALERLSISIDRGFTDRTALERDPDLAPVRDLPGFLELFHARDRKMQEVARTLRPPSKRKAVRSGRAIVDRTNTIWERRSNTLLVAFDFPAKPGSDLVRVGEDRVSALLNRWYAAGNAAGNHGDLYDNRDDGHSVLPAGKFPQITAIEYGGGARSAEVHYGVNAYLLYNATTLGNSSSAVNGRLWRSQARLAMTSRPLALQAYRHYANNHIYVFPEHRDHDPEEGDLFPANTPYMIISQGSSGSDRPFIEAVAAILAAFRPAVKEYLKSERLVAPTVQMIFRSGLQPVKSRSDYLTARAHPSVFDAADIDLERMIRLAHNLRIVDIPPVVRLSVVAESKLRTGVNYFGPSGAAEVLFDTPGAIARIVRSTAFERRMVVSAATTADRGDRPVKFIWKVLRGDANRISINPLNDDASRVTLRIAWHDAKPVPFAFRSDLTTNRVDIAVFAHTGSHYSAPAFVTLYYPPRQQRRYDGAGRILEIDYAAPGLAGRYADPGLFAQRKWRDRYRYSAKGRLLGWDRIAGKTVEQFTRHGAKVIDTDSLGRPLKAQIIRYEAQSMEQGGKEIVEVAQDSYLRYRYRSPTDQTGKAIRLKQ